MNLFVGNVLACSLVPEAPLNIPCCNRRRQVGCRSSDGMATRLERGEVRNRGDDNDEEQRARPIGSKSDSAKGEFLGHQVSADVPTANLNRIASQ